MIESSSCLERDQREANELRATLIQQAPKFTGSELLEPWIKRMNNYLQLNCVPEDEKLAIATWACQEDASSFLGDLEDNPSSFADLIDMLRSRFGKTKDQSLDEFEELQ